MISPEDSQRLVKLVKIVGVQTLSKYLEEFISIKERSTSKREVVQLLKYLEEDWSEESTVTKVNVGVKIVEEFELEEVRRIIKKD